MNARKTAAAYLEEQDPAVSVILAELAESAGTIARSWHLALELARADPNRAQEHLINAEIRLNHDVRLELRDTLRPIRRAIALLADELPDDPE